MPTIQRRRISVRTNRKGSTGRSFITPHVKKNEPGQINENTETNVQETPMAGKDEIIPKCEYPFGVSVCISAWKTAEYIEECLDSVAAQTWFLNHDNWEILLGVDGCEETLAKVKDIMHKYKNLKVMMMDRNVGTYVTCNTIMKEAKYEWLLRFDSDDMMPNDMVDKIFSNNLNGISAVRYMYYNFAGSNGQGFAWGSHMIKHNIFNKFGGYRDWRISADYDFLYRIEPKCKILKLPSVFYNRRVRMNGLEFSQDTNMKSQQRKRLNNFVKEKSRNESIIECTTEIFTTIFDNREFVKNDFCGKIYNGEKGIISLTSFRARINTVHITIESLLKHCDGYHIVLVLSSDEFPKKNNELPKTLLDLTNGEKIEILWVEKNYKALKKVAFTAQKYKEVPIISADDDCLYTCNYADELYNKSLEAPNDVIRYNMYNKDDKWQYTQGPCTLYPPKYHPLIFKPILDGLKNHTIKDYMNDDTVITKLIKKNKIHISHVYRGEKFCFKFHNENGAMHDNRKNKAFKSCYN